MVTKKFLCRNDSVRIASQLLRILSKYVKSNPIDYSYKSGPSHFLFRKRSINMEFYTSPRALGYNWTVPEYSNIPYVLCHIEEENEGKVKYAMDLGFGLEKMNFIEVFDITFYESSDCIKEAKETDLTFIEKLFKGISIYEF